MRVPTLAVVVLSALAAASLLPRASAAPAVSASQMDDLETAICREESGLRRARAAVEEIRRAEPPRLTSNATVEERRQVAMQSELQRRALRAQESIAASAEARLVEARLAYRSATGKEFDLRQCATGIIRNTHKQREQAEQDRQLQSDQLARERVLAEGEEIRRILATRQMEACAAHAVLASKAGSAQQLDAARREYDAYNSAHLRFYKKPFDPSRCPR